MVREYRGLRVSGFVTGSRALTEISFSSPRAGVMTAVGWDGYEGRRRGGVSDL